VDGSGREPERSMENDRGRKQVGDETTTNVEQAVEV